MSNPDPRQVLAEADRYRRLANGAIGIRASIRVGSAAPGHRGGILGRLVSRRNEKPAFKPFNDDMRVALDLALGKIAADYERMARDTEARVSTGAAS